VNSPLLKEQQEYRRLYHFEQAKKNELNLFEKASILAAVSDEMYQYICLKSDNHNNTHVIPNGVDAHRFHPEVAPAIIDQAKGRKIIGFVGSLKPWHDIKTLLTAFRTLIQNKDNVHLLIVGDGPLREWIEGYISGADMTDLVTITGWTDHSQLPEILKAMDIAVAPYPKLAGFYFSPLKLYEYMAVGTPVIASDIGQISKMINDGENGLLFPPGDHSALTSALEKLINNSEFCDVLGQSAVSSVAERTWQNNARKILKLVQQTRV
jgi:glycosyltransferase involved in cell wall biosynthesis